MLTHLILMLGLATGCALAQQLEAFPCDNVRRDWRTLTPGQQATYISAINQLQTTRQYPNWLQAHTNPAMDRFAHNSPGLFPWHRYYVWNYENQLRSLGGVYSCISIPYWDWTADAASGGGYIGANSQVYQAFGGPGQGQCIDQLYGSHSSPPFASFSAFRYPADAAGRFGSDCVRRQHTYQRIPTPFEMVDILIRQTSMASAPGSRVGFHYATVQPHNNVHLSIGGTQLVQASGYEPLFMLHHSFVDKLWATWQSCHGVNNFPATFADDSMTMQFSANQAMPALPNGVSPMMVADIRNLGGRGYSYAPSALEQTPQWQAAMANAAVCRGVSATGRRLLHKQKVKATVDQRLLDMIDSYKKHWDAAARTTNDTDQISFMATRKACESANNVGEYTGASHWAKMMGATTAELLSAISSPCVDVKFDNVDKAIADARAFDKKMARKMAAKMRKVQANASGPSMRPSSDFYPLEN